MRKVYRVGERGVDELTHREVKVPELGADQRGRNMDEPSYIDHVKDVAGAPNDPRKLDPTAFPPPASSTYEVNPGAASSSTRFDIPFNCCQSTTATISVVEYKKSRRQVRPEVNRSKETR